MGVFLEWLFLMSLLVHHVSGQCASVLTRTEWAGQIKSPDYPSYRKGLDCRWIIKVSLGNTVNIQFSDFSMSKPGQTFANDCSDATDFVEIFDGNATSSPLKEKFCGGKNAPVVSSSNMLLIRMKTEEENHRGFLLDFNGNCNRDVTEYEGIIQTPNYPNKYPRLTTCLWKIDFGVGMDIEMEFLDFNVEDTCSYDYATVIAGQNKPKVYCGFTLPPGESVEAGAMSIGFVSDDDTELDGFAIKYKATGFVDKPTKITDFVHTLPFPLYL